MSVHEIVLDVLLAIAPERWDELDLPFVPHARWTEVPSHRIDDASVHARAGGVHALAQRAKQHLVGAFPGSPLRSTSPNCSRTSNRCRSAAKYRYRRRLRPRSAPSPDPAQPQAGDFKAGPGPFEASVPGLKGHIAPDYPPFDMHIPDQTRADVWLREFREFERADAINRP